jgi:hypothetical protein
MRFTLRKNWKRKALIERKHDTGETSQELGRISTGKGTRPSGLSFSPESRLAYVALQSGEIAEIDLNARTVARRFKTTRTGLDGLVYVHR